MTTQIMTLERLQQLLDAHGASVVRWPEFDRRALSALMTTSAQARDMMAEAAALDRVLMAAPADRRHHLAGLTDRIVAKARMGQVVRLPITAKSRAAVGSSRWAAIAALAASLLIGVYGGLNGWAPQALQQVAGLTLDQASSANASADDIAQYGDIL